MSARREAPDATVPLVRALLADAAAAGCVARELSVEARDWASATFVGTQAWVVLALAGAGVDDWLARLPEAELPLWRHMVADIVVDADAMVAGERQVELAVLTLVAA